MCGIFGYIGPRDAAQTCVEGLKKLEYRGYDSAGVAGVTGYHKLEALKEVGRIANLESAVGLVRPQWSAAIAHTRWATHGQVSKENAHPHVDHTRSIAIVHNGIIENHQPLRERLSEQGVRWATQTDTEVVAELLASCYEGDMLVAVARTVSQLEGSYALAIVHRDFPDWIFLAAKDCPLAIGVGQGEIFIASDARAFGEHTQEVLFLEGGELAAVRASSVALYDFQLHPKSRSPHLVRALQESMSKAGYSHYMLKEIHEQPQVILDAMEGRLVSPNHPVHLPALDQALHGIEELKQLSFIACGTSFHAGCLGALWVEEFLRIPARAEIASEYRYRAPVVQEGTLTCAISQSGETADTLAALREAAAAGSPTFGLCNVEGSTLHREASATALLGAGMEVSVASTKAFTSQLGVLALSVIKLAECRGISGPMMAEMKRDLAMIPQQVEEVLRQAPAIREVARGWASFDRFFFIGRRHLVPVALEAALKLKEIAYVDASGYAAGELKHGPIALIDAQSPTVAFCTNRQTASKMLSNLSEIQARGGPICVVSFADDTEWDAVAQHRIVLPSCPDWLAPFTASVVCQLFAYYVALERGCEIDQPRNLAKSVTVE
jgi:glucosamine--fructose-6-phosphate aminotransferase (isomerizing)